MQVFFHPGAASGTVELPDEEVRHLAQVLRKRTGDEITLVDGKGGWYKGTITHLDKRHCHLSATLERQEEQRSGLHITLAVSPIKSTDRYEWYLEKATEIGVDELVPLLCQRTERSHLRLDRWEKLLASAMKQSAQAWLPKLSEGRPFADFVQQQAPDTTKFIPWCDGAVPEHLAKLYTGQQRVCLLIGPEGDFTLDEIALARANGFIPVNLGQNRLRTETAAIAALQTIHTIHELR